MLLRQQMIEKIGCDYVASEFYFVNCIVFYRNQLEKSERYFNCFLYRPNSLLLTKMIFSIKRWIDFCNFYYISIISRYLLLGAESQWEITYSEIPIEPSWILVKLIHFHQLIQLSITFAWWELLLDGTLPLTCEELKFT